METLNDLLPGIEEFLVDILANENLSVAAEEKRQYFVERLDILKLPPSIPPRPGRRSCHGSCDGSQNEIDAVDDPVECVPDDFAAYQRELARTFAQVPPPAKKESKSEHVKIYDDIDSSESANEEDKEVDLYEIPVVRQSEESCLPCSPPNDSSSLATATSIDDITDEVAETCPPPPLPPRRDRTTSEATNRSTESIASDKPPDLPSRPPPQSKKNNNNNKSKKSVKSDKSDNGITDGDSTSYESYEEEEKMNDVAQLNKLNIKLPKRAKKESNRLKKKLSNSRSSTQWEQNVPFKSLTDIVLSGDLYYKGVLSWNRRLVALVNGNLVCYKPDKETRPNLVISLPGYEATYSERDNKKGFEIKLSHPYCDVHCFSVDFKEWAQTWCDNINKMSQGLSAPGSHQHLARSFIGNNDLTYPSFGGSKSSLSSQLSWDGPRSMETSPKSDSKLGGHLTNTFSRLADGRRSYTLNHKFRNSPISWFFDRRQSSGSSCTLLTKRSRSSSSSTLDSQHDRSWDRSTSATNTIQRNATSSCLLERKRDRILANFDIESQQRTSSSSMLDDSWENSYSICSVMKSKEDISSDYDTNTKHNLSSEKSCSQDTDNEPSGCKENNNVDNLPVFSITTDITWTSAILASDTAEDSSHSLPYTKKQNLMPDIHGEEQNSSVATSTDIHSLMLTDSEDGCFSVNSSMNSKDGNASGSAMVDYELSSSLLQNSSSNSQQSISVDVIKQTEGKWSPIITSDAQLQNLFYKTHSNDEVITRESITQVDRRIFFRTNDTCQNNVRSETENEELNIADDEIEHDKYSLPTESKIQNFISKTDEEQNIVDDNIADDNTEHHRYPLHMEGKIQNLISKTDDKEQNIADDIADDKMEHDRYPLPMESETQKFISKTDDEDQNIAVVVETDHEDGLPISTQNERQNSRSKHEEGNISDVEEKHEKQPLSCSSTGNKLKIKKKVEGVPLTNLTGSLARWDWKTLFYNWTFPLDHIIRTLRRPELNSSNSNISNASSDGLIEDSRKPKLRGNKVMRMGSFAYRATMFFENLGKKPSGKRKSPSDGLSMDLKAGIEEECSLSSSSSGLPLLTPSSDSHDAVFEDPLSLLCSPGDMKHAGYLEVFSSFNKRRWGKRFCLVKENMFECYKTEQSKTCELNFLLKPCMLRQATAETNSVYSLMLLEGGKEKITVEASSKEEMRPWVRALMQETANESIPAGLEEYFEDYHSSEGSEEKHDFSDLLGYSVIKSWDLASEHYKGEASDEVVTGDVPSEKQTGNKDVYSEVVKKSSTGSSFSMVLPGIEESLEVFDEQKHTSDSGFVSVHCFNSDSESDSGCAVKSEDESRTYDSKHLVTHLDRDSTSREVTPIDDSRERTLVAEDSNAESEQTERMSDMKTVKTDVKSDTISDENKIDSVLENKNIKINNNIENEEDFKNSVLDEDHEKVELDKTLCDSTGVNLPENSVTDLVQISGMNSVCDSVSNNESTNHDLLSVKDSIQNLTEHSSELTETEKSSITSNFSISEKLEHNSSMVVSSEDDCEDGEILSSKPLSDSQNEETSGKLNSLSNSKTEEMSRRICENNESLGKDKNANDEDSRVEMKNNACGSEATDIQLRIKRLREKLVQIKRKRIAVNDKRKRVDTDDEKFLCDEEYSLLEEQCKRTDREISQLLENF